MWKTGSSTVTMEWEMRRIATFRSKPLTLSAVPSLALARAGFFLTSKGTVRTYCCQAEVAVWNCGEDPVKIHNRLSPKCRAGCLSNNQSFVGRQGNAESRAGKQGTGNTEVRRSIRKCKRNKMAGEELGNDDVSPGSTSDLSKEKQETKQRSVDFVMIDNDTWRKDVMTARRSDTPELFEYMKDEFKRLETFNDFPTDVPVSKELMVEAGFFYTGSRDRVRCHCCRGVLWSWEPEDVPADEHRRHFPQCTFIKTNRLSTSAPPRMKPDEVITPSENEQPTHMQHKLTDKAESTKRAEVTETSEAEDVTVSSKRCADLERENAALREEHQCKVCMDADVDTVFLPCGHLLSCSACAVQLRACPICRENIKGTINTYLS